MASTAANLVDHVLPNQPMRQYVFTFPQPLPRLLAWRPELLERVLADIAHVGERNSASYVPRVKSRPEGRSDGLQIESPDPTSSVSGPDPVSVTRSAATMDARS